MKPSLVTTVAFHDLFLRNNFKFSAFNIVGWRDKNYAPDVFNDYISVFKLDENYYWEGAKWKATTLPGVPWLRNPLSGKGAPILMPGQYKDVYELGTYRGYTALKQIAPVVVFRDSNRDSNYDLSVNTVESGIFGIHIHKASFISKIVGLWSAGCQVFKSSADFADFIEMCEASNFTKFTYTLIEL